jgi:hypothetical protein
VRWDNLFDDLEGQLEQELQAEEIDLHAEEERLRLGRLSLRSRLASLSGQPGQGCGDVLRVALVSGETITIRPTTFGRDWLAADLLDGAAPGAQCVLPLAAIAAVILHHDQVAPSLGAEPESAARLVDRIGLPFVLRDLCRRRKSLLLHTQGGLVTGTIDRVGRDHVDVAVHEPGTLRRAGEVRHYRIVPLAQIQLVQLG